MEGIHSRGAAKAFAGVGSWTMVGLWIRGAAMEGRGMFAWIWDAVAGPRTRGAAILNAGVDSRISGAVNGGRNQH
jgi:hypothetical protein